MAPSGGSKLKLGQDTRKMKLFGIIFVELAAVLLLLQCGTTDGAAIAKRLYYMDKQSDCINVGILDMPRDQVTYIRVRAGSGADGLSCILQFAPKQSGDTLRIWFEKNAFISNCDVSLTVKMTNNRDFVYGCRSNALPEALDAVNGRGSLSFRRGKLGSTTYDFTIGVQARRTLDPAGAGDASTDDVGMIVGIIAGAIVLIILLLVLCVCCYRRNKRDRDFKVADNANNLTASAFENGTMKQKHDYTAGDSPASDRRLLTQNSNDYDPEDGLKPKSALDRFGPIPVRRSDRPQAGNRQARDAPKQDREASEPQGSPILDALRNNPKFRRSFHDTEGDADRRANRISGSENSSVSYNSNGVQLPPELPPVPRSPQRSPSPERKGEKIAGIFRARPSSSEIAMQLEGKRSDDLESLSEFVPAPPKDRKGDTRHVLRPNRNERQSRPNQRRKTNDDEDDYDDSEEERKEKRREKERRKKQEEAEEEEEEERRRKKKERERKRRQEEEDKEDDRLEGRFKKSASGRKSKGKGPRIGRSKSTGNALEEMEDNYQRSRSKSPSSVRSLNFIEDNEDDDLDSSYMPFKRAGSKTSLYASRSSLYGRRRKNSCGETVSISSYAHDDMDSRIGDFDRRTLTKRDKDKMFRSTGELEMRGATAQVVRECATQTDSSKGVYIYGRKTLAKSRPGKMYSRGCQTGRTRRDSTGSARSGKSSRMKKSRSMESLRKKRSRSRNLDVSNDSSDDRRSHRSKSRDLDESYDSSDNRSRRSRSRNLDLDSDDDDNRRRGKGKKHHRSKSRGLEDDDDDDRQSSKGKGSRPKARPRKSTGAASVDLSDSDDGRSQAASSIAPSYVHPSSFQPNPYGAQYIPVMYPPPPNGMTFVPTAPGGPPMMPIPGDGRPPIGPKPPLAPKPKKSKWDQLVEMTDGEKQRDRHQRADSPTESMLTSVYSHAPPNGANQANYYPAPPSYNTAQKYPNPNSTISSAYPDSSGMPMSNRGPRQFTYTPSESEI